MKFIITHTAYEIVERRYLVEADNEDDAFDYYIDGCHEELLSEDCNRLQSEIDIAIGIQGADGIWNEKGTALESEPGHNHTSTATRQG